MKNYKKYIVMLLITMMICTVPGCSSAEKNFEQEATSTEEQNAEEENEKIHIWVEHADQSIEDYKKRSDGSEIVTLTNADGNLIYFVAYNVNNDTTIRTEYEYDENSQKNKVLYCSGDGNLFSEFATGRYHNASFVDGWVKDNATDTVQYGDTIRVSCKKGERRGNEEIKWIDAGECELLVDTTAKEFQIADYVYPYEYVKKNLKEAIGKKVGDTFTLWFEFGDGRVGYEYTIREIKNTEIEKMSSYVLEDGDEVAVLVRERNQTEDALKDWGDIHNVFLEWTIPEEAIDKTVGETYTVWSEDSDYGSGYEYLILKIMKSTKNDSNNTQIDNAEDLYVYYDEMFNSAELDLTPKVGEFLTENENYEIIEAADGAFYGYSEDYWGGCSKWCAVSRFEENAISSSSLSPQGNNTYGADNIISHNRENAWVEGVKGDGIGEYISLSKCYERGEDYGERDCFFFTDLCIVNGMAKDEQSWKDNNRVKVLKLYFNDEYICDLELLDTMKPQYISLSGLHLSAGNRENSVFKFEIADVYKGDLYDDTVITGIEINYFTQNH